MTVKSVLPDAVRQLPFTDKVKLLITMDPECEHAIDLLVTGALEIRWREEFHTGPRGGLKLKTQKKGGA